MGSPVSLIETHKLFIQEEQQLCPESGHLFNAYVWKEDARSLFNSRGDAIGAKGWFLIRKLWLEAIGEVQRVSDSKDLSVYYTSFFHNRISG